MTTEETNEHDHVVIFIDGEQYRPTNDDLTGSQIRQLVNPAIGPDRDLWLDVPGASDEKIENDQVVELKNGMHFFTAPAQTNPGLDAVTR